MARVGLTTERLVRAGAELADEVGFEQVTVSALARRFDVKVASLYSHVKNSQDLKTRIALLALEELADRAADAVAGRSGKDALAALGNVYRDYAHEHPGRYAATQLRLDPEAAAASAGAQALADDAGDPARLRPDGAGPDARGTAARRRLPRLHQPGDGRRVQPQRPRHPGDLGADPGRARRPAAELARPDRPHADGESHADTRHPTGTIRPDQQCRPTTPITTPSPHPSPPNLLRGALELERTEHGVLPHRLPARARAQGADAQLAMAESQPSGVRLAFRTRATAVELDTLPTKRVYVGAPPRPDGVYDLLVDGRLAGRAAWPAATPLTIDMTDGRRQHRARPGRHPPLHRPARRRQGRRDLAAAQRDDRTRRPAHRRPRRARAGPGPQGVAAPRQFDQPRLRRREPHDHLARTRRLARWRRTDQPGPRRQRPARPVHRPRPCGTPPPT